MEFDSDADAGDGEDALSGVESGSNDDSGVKVDGSRSRKNDLATLFEAVDNEVRFECFCLFARGLLLMLVGLSLRCLCV